MEAGLISNTKSVEYEKEISELIKVDDECFLQFVYEFIKQLKKNWGI